MHDNRRDTYPIGCKSNAVAHNVDCQSGHMEMCHVRMSLRKEEEKMEREMLLRRLFIRNRTR